MNKEIPPFSDDFQSPPPVPPIQLDKDVGTFARTWRFAFQGSGMEYFKIWITNLFLTIITLTLYAPWAKVRRLRYFYGNTYLNRRKFDFTGVPLRIFYGRILALVLYGVFAWVSQLSVEANIWTFLLIFIAVPWIVRSSHRFMARNSKYANGRFYFSAGMARTYGTFIGCILITIFSLGLLFPIALLFFKRYQLNHLYVGQLPFRLNASIADFFVAILLPVLLFMGSIIIAIALVFFSINSGDVGGVLMVIGVLFYMFAILYLGPLVQGYLFKATWSRVEVGNSQITTDVNPWQYAWIQVTNSIAIIFSLGLLFAWAQVRIYRYKIESISVEFFDDPQQIYNKAQQDHHALGEELADIFDIDIAI